MALKWSSPWMPDTIEQRRLLLTGIEEIGAVVAIAGTVLSAAGAAQQASAQQAAQQYQADALRKQAMAERGAASVEAAQEQRKKAIVMERAQAVAAASGAGAQDPTVETVEGNIAGQGEYNSLMRLATGEQRARGLETQASADVFSGQQTAQAGQIKTFGSVLSGASSFYDKYGAGGFTMPNAPYDPSGADWSAGSGGAAP